MQYNSTLRCSITDTGSIRGNIFSGTTFEANFSIPSQIESEHFTETYEYIPTWDEQIIPTANKLLDSDIHIDSIQTYETSNEYGTTFII